MVDVEVIHQTPVTMTELKVNLEKAKKEKKELNFRENKVLEYLNMFAELNEKDVAELKKQLEGLGIVRLKDRHIVKIVDLMPKDEESLKVILSGENTTLKAEDLTKIVEVIKKS